MSHRANITIVIGMLLFAATLVACIVITGPIAASAPEITASPQEHFERKYLAETLQTTFMFIAILELMLTGLLAYRWRKSDIPLSHTDLREANQDETTSARVHFLALTGILAFVTSYVSALLDVFVFDIYGGLGLNTLICLGLPAGLFGVLGGSLWRKVTRKSGFTPIDLVSSVIIGILAGLIPVACFKLLPQ